MKTLLVVGDDKIGRTFLNSFSVPDDVKIGLDRSSTLLRALKILARRRLSLKTAWRIFWADVQRTNVEFECAEIIESNGDLLRLIDRHDITHVLLFRAGLIVSQSVIGQAKVINIHCARIPEFGGLGAIDKALTQKAFTQCATLHVVTETIDRGKVIGENPYLLDSQKSYKENEDNAYRAGFDLAKTFFQKGLK